MTCCSRPANSSVTSLVISVTSSHTRRMSLARDGAGFRFAPTKNVTIRDRLLVPDWLITSHVTQITCSDSSVITIRDQFGPEHVSRFGGSAAGSSPYFTCPYSGGKTADAQQFSLARHARNNSKVYWNVLESLAVERVS